MDSLDVDVISSFTLLMCMYSLKKKRAKRRQRRFEIRPINRERRRAGTYSYYRKMKSWDLPQFFKFTRMTVSVFEKLLVKVKPLISRQKRSDGISAEERLVITLQYLSQGTSMQVLAWNFQIGHATVHKIIHETCKAIWDVLSPEYMKSPNNQDEWLRVANGFEEKWHFPHCLGALDGKHVNIEAPAKSGSLYFNYKKKFSIVLLAACDWRYRFLLVDIGAYGSQSDGGIFKNSVFGQRLEHSDLNIPISSTINGMDHKVPYFLVADEAFPLKKYIMRPYGNRNSNNEQRVFNYRLSRARQMIENTFGILVARWRILKTTINAKVENVDHIVKAVTVLHNYCMTELEGHPEEDNIYCPAGYADTSEKQNGRWREEQTPLQSVGRQGANRATTALYELRDTLAHYFTSGPGQVNWQDKIVNGVRVFN